MRPKGLILDSMNCRPHFFREKLNVLDSWNQRRTGLAEQYLNALSGPSRPDLAPCPRLGRTGLASLCGAPFPREELQQRLNEAGVSTLIHYPIPPHKSEAYNELCSKSFPLAEKFAASVLSLPIGPHLSNFQLLQIIDAIR